jgi:thiosulfate dehydrogenase
VKTTKRLAAAGFGAAIILAAQAAAAADAASVKRGEYVAQLGDCVACHTAEEGPSMAGGRALETPFGKIYTTNITPDRQSGIGNYTFEQFDRAMRTGVAADGHNLYPAMPYPSYSRTSVEDMRALYAYLMQDVVPVERKNKPAEMHWPFSMRWGLSLWNRVFVDAAPFKPDANKDAVWNRGAYLVQGLGHCGSCHTPRGIAFQEKAMTEAGQDYLAGETVEHWRALSLRNLWTVDDTVQLLKTGRNRFATVSGNMVDVVHNSTQHFTDDDLRAIATYLKSLPAGPNDKTPPATPTAMAAKVPEDTFKTRGGLGYVQFCVDCHRLDGNGVPDIFPPLAQNPTILADDASTLLHVMLTGSKTAKTASHPRVLTMPGFSPLADKEIAEIVSFVRASWGRGKPIAVSAGDVKKMRASLMPKGDFAAGFDTPRLADLLGEPNAEQLVRGMRLHLQTKDLLQNNVGNQMNCTSCHLNAGTVADGSPFVGVAGFFPSYGARAGRVITIEERINGCFKRSMNGKVVPKASPDMKAMVAYFDWMRRGFKENDKVPGRGIGKINEALEPNVVNGKRIYGEQCALCHGRDGEGIKSADGKTVYPPLWGDQSFNIGAGLARTYKAAAFVKQNMPIAMRDRFPLGQGGLSDQEAVDVAEYFTHMPRPDFPEKLNDWPKDKKPADARY